MRKKRRILIIEQNNITTKVIKHLLTLWGYEFFLAEKGFQALEMIRCLMPDLILVSFELPDMPVSRLIHRLRKDPLTAYLPILLLIGHKRSRYQLLKEQIPFDDYLLTPPDPMELRLRVEQTLRRTEQNLQANPLTRLPGSLAIEKETEDRIARGEFFSVCHYDIDRFKAFNDAYGYDRGNGVLCQMARILIQTVRAAGEGSDFLGHIGGDDFVVVTHPDRHEAICHLSIHEFDRLMLLHYPSRDRERGYISVTNRLGKEQQFPLMTLSIAVTTNRSRRLESSHQVSEIASDIKRYLKLRSSPKSLYLVDRRQDPDLPASSVKKRKESQKEKTGSRPTVRSKALGQMLLEEKVITSAQLDDALRRHWQSAQKLGQILIEMKLITSEQLGGLLSKQLGMPYVNLQSAAASPVQEVPKEFAQEHAVVPLSKEKGRLFIAMTDPLDQKIIQEVEKLAGCSVEPRVTTEADIQTMADQQEAGQAG